MATNPFRLRFALNNPGVADIPVTSLQLMVSYNGGAYYPVTVSSAIVVATAAASSSPDGTVIKVPDLTPGP